MKQIISNSQITPEESALFHPGPQNMPPPSSLPAAHLQLPAATAESTRRRKYRSMKEIMKVAKRVQLIEDDDEEGSEISDGSGGGGGGVIAEDDYSGLTCEQCGSGERADELLLCDRCDKGYHMLCLRPIVVRVPIGPWFCPDCPNDKTRRAEPIKCFTQKKIVNFFRIQKDEEFDGKCASPQDVRKRHKRTLVVHKKRRRLLPYVSSADPKRRLAQMASLASALTAQNMEFSNELTYVPGMAPRSANQAILENGGMQVLCKDDIETFEFCRAMYKRGKCPPLIVTFDSCEGYTVEADGPIKDLTLLAEYTGDVDYIKNRELDDCDSLMTLLLSNDPSESLVVCPDKRGNIARFVSGINNHTPESRKKVNVKCLRYDVYGECRVLLVATRDIVKGERLYYDYNGYENAYPTHNFV